MFSYAAIFRVLLLKIKYPDEKLLYLKDHFTFYCKIYRAALAFNYAHLQQFIYVHLYTGWPKKVSHKVLSISCQILTDFQNFFTSTFCEQFVVKWLLNIPPHFNCVVTLPCEI